MVAPGNQAVDYPPVKMDLLETSLLLVVVAAAVEIQSAIVEKTPLLQFLEVAVQLLSVIPHLPPRVVLMTA